jgi:hypothetical protein
VGTVSAKDVFINSTSIADCTAEYECWFFNPSLWVNESIPEQYDQVFISELLPGYSMFVNASIDLTLLSITSNFHLLVTGSTTNFTSINITLNGGAQLRLQDGATVYGLETTRILNSSLLSIAGFAFAQDGVHFYLDNSSSIYVFGGYLGLHATTVVMRGTLNVAATAMFTSTGGVIEFHQAHISFENTPIIWDATFIESNVAFSNGWRSIRSANLIASKVAIQNSLPSAVMLNNFMVDEDSELSLSTQDPSYFSLVNSSIIGVLTLLGGTLVADNLNAPLLLGGNCALNVTDLTIKTIASQEPVNVAINTQSFFLVGGESDFPKAIINTHFAYFRGAIHIDGNVSVAQVMTVEDSSLVVYGDLNIGWLYGVQAIFAPTVLLDEAQVTVDHLRIADFGKLHANFSEVSGNVSLHYNATLDNHYSNFTGYFHNNGYIEVRYPLHVSNYTQGSTGVLLSFLELGSRSSGYLRVDGYAVLDGTILYSVGSNPSDKKKQTLPVVETTHGVSGRFAQAPEDVSASGHTLSLEYSANGVYLVYGKNPSSPASLWWIWFIVAIGLIIVVGLVVLLLKNYRRKNYNRVDN